MSALLARHESGDPNFDCRCLTAPLDGSGDAINCVDLRRAVDELFRDPADVALFHFSGHGTANNLDGYLVGQDASRYNEGLAMTEVLKLANSSRAAEVVIFLDCCHSGHLGNPPVINNERALLREGISVLSASRGEQVSVETTDGGLFTSLVADALEGGAADVLGDVTAPAIYAYVEGALGAWDQRPLFKSHLSRVLPLRKCRSPIDLAIVRELPIIFPVPAEDMPLSPEFEPSSGCADPAKCAVFAKLQALSRCHLVVPLHVAHMYEAAMQSTGCKLTATGRYYWRLALNGRI